MRLSKWLLCAVAGLGVTALSGAAVSAQEYPGFQFPHYQRNYSYPGNPASQQDSSSPVGRAIVTVINDTEDQMVLHINDTNYGWLRPGQSRDIAVPTPGKTVINASSHDGDVYVHTFHNPVGYVVWYINEGH
ncbi:MAG: hypothetical protein JO112_16310 [Planctomycetes bacterium]|nr:hypothetical protein [Planctomycetota bacterium]